MSFKESLQGIAGVITVLVSAGAFAVEAPSPDTAASVVDYYYSDASQPVLIDFKLCQGVHEEGENKHNCKNEISEGELHEGMQAYLWMKFLVPREASPQILMQVSHKGVTRDTMKRQLDGAVRFRTWNVVELSRSGDWQAQVFHESGDDVTEIFSRTLKVEPEQAEAESGMDEDMSGN